MKKTIKALSVFLTIICLILSVTSCSVQSTEEYYSSSSQTDSGKYAYITIDCKNILDNYDDLDENLKDEKYVPTDGVILEETKYSIEEGDTALTILEKATKDKKIHLDYQSAEESPYGTAYVKGINNIYEGSCGDMSGWSYNANGDTATVACSDYELKDGDKIQWEFICSFEME